MVRGVAGRAGGWGVLFFFAEEVFHRAEAFLWTQDLIEETVVIIHLGHRAKVTGQPHTHKHSPQP